MMVSTTSAPASSMTTTYYVFVIAHPDDESMFFVPTIRALVDERLRKQQQLKHQHNSPHGNYVVWILCLTTGNYDGLGLVRRDELIQVAYGPNTILGCDKVIFLDDESENDKKNDEQLLLLLPQDHPTKRWNKEYVSSKIEETLIQHIKMQEQEEESEQQQVQEEEIDEKMPSHRRVVLITFDELGVSGHVNHRDTYYSVFDRIMKQMILGPSKVSIVEVKNKKPSPRTTKDVELHIEGWQLYTEQNIFKKYIPIYDWIMFVYYWLCRLLQQLLLIVSGSSTRNGGGTSSSFSSNNMNESSLSSLLMDGESSSSSSSSTTTTNCITFRNYKPWINWYAMKTHASQFVWYRRLFVIFSCYTYCNHLQPMIQQQRRRQNSSSNRKSNSNDDDTTTTNKQKKKEE